MKLLSQETYTSAQIIDTEFITIDEEFKPKTDLFHPTYQYLKDQNFTTTYTNYEDNAEFDSSDLAITPNYSYEPFDINVSPSVVSSDFGPEFSPVSNSCFTGEFQPAANAGFKDYIYESNFPHNDGICRHEYHRNKIQLNEPLPEQNNGVLNSVGFNAQSSFTLVSEDEQRTAEILLRNIHDDFWEDDRTPKSTDNEVSTPEDRVDLKQLSKLADSRRKRRNDSKRSLTRGSSYNGESEDAVPEANDEYVPVLHQILNNKVIFDKISLIKKKGIYKCSHCSEYFPDLIKLAQHLDTFEILRPFKCPFNDCPWSILGLPRKAEVRRHCLAQHEFQITSLDGENCPAKVESFPCPYGNCVRVFKRKDSFRRHEKLVHLTPTSRFNKRMMRLQEENKKHEYTEIEKYLDVSKVEY